MPRLNLLTSYEWHNSRIFSQQYINFNTVSLSSVNCMFFTMHERGELQ